MRWKMVFEQDKRDVGQVYHGSARYSASVYAFASTGRGCDRKVRTNLGGNTEVKAFVLSVQVYIFRTEAFFCEFHFTPSA